MKYNAIDRKVTEQLMEKFLDTQSHEDIGKYIEYNGHGDYQELEDCEWDNDWGEYMNPDNLYELAMDCLNNMPSELWSLVDMEREWLKFMIEKG